MLHCRTAYRAIFGAATYNVLVSKELSADKAIDGANLIGYAFDAKENATKSTWTNFGGVLKSAYTPSSTTGASDVVTAAKTTAPVAPPARTVAPTAAANSVKASSGVTARAAASATALLLMGVVVAIGL